MKSYRAIIALLPQLLLALSSLLAQVPKLDIFAHRGFRGVYPENTIPAMRQALHQQAVLEFDLVITKDKQVVLSHDPVLDRKITLNSDGQPLSADDKWIIYQMDYDEIRSFDIGLKPNEAFPLQQRYPAHMPLFSELIDSMENEAQTKGLPLPRYFAETKSREKTDQVNHPAPEEFVDIIMDIIHQKGIEDRIIIQSFDPRTLQVLHKKHPRIAVALLARRGTTLSENLKTLGFVPHYYSPNAEYFNEELVKEAQELGTRLIIGNCNDYEEIKRVNELGVYQVITDYPLDYLENQKR